MLTAALPLPKSGETSRGAQFPCFALLTTAGLDGLKEAFFSSGLIV